MAATTAPAQPVNERFEEIWGAEMLVKGEMASVAFAGAGTPLHVKERNAGNLKKARQRLSDLLDALTIEEQKAYGEYRRGIFAEIEAIREAHRSA